MSDKTTFVTNAAVEAGTQKAVDREDLPDQLRIDQLQILRRWLANEDIYTSEVVRDWLQRTQPHEAADSLARIAETAYPDPHTLGFLLFHGYMTVFTTSEIVTPRSPAGRRAGVRAALLLAKQNDARCLLPLIRVFETYWFWEGKYQEDIESALLQFLTDAADSPEIIPCTADIVDLVRRNWKSGGGHRELSSRRTDLLIAALQCLKATANQPESPSRKLIHSIARTKARTPNRRRASEFAAALLERS